VYVVVEWLAVVDGAMERLVVLPLAHHKLFKAGALNLMKISTRLPELDLES
jgi:hypothetical protein